MILHADIYLDFLQYLSSFLLPNYNNLNSAIEKLVFSQTYNSNKNRDIKETMHKSEITEKI